MFAPFMILRLANYNLMYRQVFVFLLLQIVLSQATPSNPKFTWCTETPHNCSAGPVCGLSISLTLDFTDPCVACGNPIIKGYYLDSCNKNPNYKLPQEPTLTNKVTKTVTTTENGTLGVVASQSAVIAPSPPNTPAQPVSTVTTVTSFTMPKAFSCQQLRNISCIPQGGAVCGRSTTNKFTNFSNKCQACRDPNISQYTPTVCPNTDIISQVPTQLPNTPGQPINNLNSLTALPTFVPIPLANVANSAITTGTAAISAGVNNGIAALQNATAPLLTTTSRIINTTAADGTNTIQNTTTTTITTLQNATTVANNIAVPPVPTVVLTTPITSEPIPQPVLIQPAIQPNISTQPTIATINNVTTVVPNPAAAPNDLQLNVQNTTIKTVTVQPTTVVTPTTTTLPDVNMVNPVPVPVVPPPGLTTTMTTTTVTTFANAGQCNALIRNNCVSDGVRTCGFTAAGSAIDFADICQACSNTQIVRYQKQPCPQAGRAIPLATAAAPVPVPTPPPAIWPPVPSVSEQTIATAMSPPPATMTAIEISDQAGKKILRKITFVPFNRTTQQDTIFPLFMCNYYFRFICFDDKIPVCGLQANGDRINYNNSCQACENNMTELFVKTTCRHYGSIFSQQPEKPFQTIQIPSSRSCSQTQRSNTCVPTTQQVCGFTHNQVPRTYDNSCSACRNPNLYMWVPGTCPQKYNGFVICNYARSRSVGTCPITGQRVCGIYHDQTKKIFNSGCEACQDDKVRGYRTKGC